MITHIKRSIPDLRAIKHQPLENKESPKHQSGGGGGGGGDENGCAAGTSGIGAKSIALRSQMSFGLDGLGCSEKDADAVTLSAVQTTSCTCGPNKGTTNEHVTLAAQIDKTSGDLDDEDAMLNASGHHHHYHYHPYQQHQQMSSQPPSQSHQQLPQPQQHLSSHQPGPEVR